MKDLEILKEVLNAKIAIQHQTMSEILDKTDPKHILYQKITNASLSLYINAYRLAIGKKPLLTTIHNTLSLENIKLLMNEISNTLAKPLFAKEIETQIVKLFQTYSLNPEELFVEHVPSHIEYSRVQKILNGD